MAYYATMRLPLGVCDVRSWRPADAASIVEHANNRKVWRNLTDRFPHPYGPEDAERWFCMLEGMREPTHWAIEVEGHAVGGVGVILREDVYAKSGAFGYWLGEAYWGRGIATRVVKAVAPYAMSRFGLVRLESPVFAWNPASMRSPTSPLMRHASAPSGCGSRSKQSSRRAATPQACSIR